MYMQYIQPIIKFEVFEQIIPMNTNSGLPETKIFRYAIGLYAVSLGS